MRTKKKKGFSPADINSTLVLIVGIAVATLVLIFVGSLSGQTYELVQADIETIGNASVTAFAVTGSNSTAQSLGVDDIHTASFKLYNSTGVLFGSGNYTLDSDAGTLLVVDALNGQSFLANFSAGDLTIQSYVKDSITSAFKANKTTGDYLPLIVLAAIIGLVLTMVLSFGGTSRGGAAL